MLRNLPLLVLFFCVPFLAKAQEPCEVVFELYGLDTLCTNGNPIQLPAVEPLGGTYSGPGVSPEGVFTPSGLSAGEYEVTYTADSAVCIGSGTATLILFEPTPFTLVGTTEVCVGGSTVLSTLEGFELTWGDGVKSVLHEYAPDSTFQTFALYSDSVGCTYVYDFTISVIDFDSTGVVAPQQVCYGQEITIDVVNATYVQWLSDLSEATRITATFTQDTTLELKIYVGSCDSIFSFTIDVADSLQYEFFTDTTLCTGQPAVLVADGNPLSYRIDGYGEEFTDSIEFELMDDATLYVQVFGEFGCTGDAYVSYIVDDYPSLAVTYPDSVCESFPIEIYATGALEYIWLDLSNGDTLLTGSQQDFQLTAEQSLHWSIIGSSLYDCRIAQDIDVYVDPTPDVRIDTLTAFCLERPILLQANGAFSYIWSNGFVGDTLELIGSTDTAFSVIGATSLGCINYDTLNIVVHEVPVVTAFGENSICELDTATVTAIGAATYVWEGILEGETVDLTPTADSAISFVGYTVYGCADFSVFNINVDPAPVIQFVGPDYLCEGDSSSLEIVTDGVFTWLGGSQENIIPMTPAADTAYVVTSIGGNGCPRTVAFDVAVYPYPQLSFNGPETLCYGDSAQVMMEGADVFIWSNGLQGDSVVFVPQATQTILIYGSSNEGCTTIYPFAITVHPRPQVQFSFSADTLCASGTGISWTASPGGGTLSGDGIVNNWFDLGSAINGVNVVSYTVANEFNCESTATDELMVQSCLLDEEFGSVSLAVFPNPVTDEFTIKGTATGTYRMLDNQGKVVMAGTISGSKRIQVASLQAGMYFLEVISGSSVETVHVVKL